MMGTVSSEDARLTDQLANLARCCPKCQSWENVFRGGKQIAAEAEEPEAVETKDRKACGKEWNERVVR